MPESTNDRKHALQKPLPQCRAFLVCMEVEFDDLTGQINLFGIVSSLGFSRFPAGVPPLALFLQLYDGIGRYRLTAELRDLVGGVSVEAEAFTDVEFPERLVKMDLALPINSLRLPSPGRYEIAVLLDGRELVTQFIDAEVTNDDETR